RHTRFSRDWSSDVCSSIFHDGPVDLAEVHAPFTHQELILREALGLGDDVTVNPSGGALAANPVMAAGLIRLGEAAQRISRGEASSGERRVGGESGCARAAG